MKLSNKWLAGMNAEWQIINPKLIFEERTDKSKPSDVHLTPSQTYGVLPQSEYMEKQGTGVVLNLVGADNMKHVEKNDFIIHLRSFQGGIEFSSYAGKVSNAYCVLKTKDAVEPRFFRWVLKSSGYIQELNSTTNQLRDGQSIKFEQFASIGLPYPPLDEQRRIADYLSYKCIAIDNGIALHKEIAKNIKELTKSERDFEIRGNPVESITVGGWLGSVNSNWSVIRLGRLVSFKSGAGFPDSYQGNTEGDYPFIKVGDIAGADEYGHISKANNYINSPEAKILNARVAPKGTIIFPKVGAALLANARAILDVPAVFDNNVMGLKFKDGEIRYWYHVLRAIDMARICNPGPVPSIGAESVSNIMVPFPNTTTQKDIAKRLDALDESHSRLLDINQGAIDKLSEYKTSLITAAVAGTFDVTTGRSVA